MSDNINKYNIDEELFNLLLDAVWIMRWNEDKTAMSAVLSDIEAINIVNDIILSLKQSNYEIKKIFENTHQR